MTSEPKEVAPVPDRKRLWGPDVARAGGLSAASVARYHSLAKVSRRNEAEGRPGRLPDDRDLPAPDGYGYRPPRVSGSPSPWWWPETIAPWLAARKGITPGRPRAGGQPAQPRKTTRAKPGPHPKQRTRPRPRRSKAA
jgi:hypothetical protein